MNIPAEVGITFPTDLARYRSLLTKHFGYPDFRSGQAEVLTSLGQGDVLAVMPTGSGKSLCYVLPALVVGKTVVVSPLVALMQDQVESQQANGVAATFINSTIDRDEQNRRYLQYRRGEVSLLYVAPERFLNDRFAEALLSSGVNLLAIDEAHCVSEWGHDFRPDYLMLGWVRERLGNPRTLALTATAEPKVRQDILSRLGMKNACQVIAPVDRPNLRFAVEVLPDKDERMKRAVSFAQSHGEDSGLIYVRTRAGTEEMAAALQRVGIKAEAYHAGLGPQRRADVQRRLLHDELHVVAATVAFGLGVNKPDVRYVMHYNMPGSLEAYYQQAGRAGRDGEPADCVLCYGPQETRAQTFFIELAHPNDVDVRTRWQSWVASEAIATPAVQGDNADSANSGLAMTLSALRASGLVDERGRRVSSDKDAPIDTRVIATHREQSFARLYRMADYARSTDCRKSLILRYFGDVPKGPCGTCDNCGSRSRVPPVEKPVGRTKCPAHSDGYHRFNLPATIPAKGYMAACACGRRFKRREEEDATIPSSPAKPKATGAQTAQMESRLRRWRKERADKDGVPAFTVFWDRTLLELAEQRPATPRDLLRVFGMGSAKVQRFGDELLAVIRGW